MSGSIGGYTIDVFVVEDHTREAEATDLPVEKGTNITHHVRMRPGMLAVECVVSDSPMPSLADERGFADVGPNPKPSKEARAFLDALIEACELVTVVTSVRVYDSMVLLSIGENITSETGKAMRFRATFKQIRVVANDRVRVPVAAPRNAKKNKRGAVAAKAVGAAGSGAAGAVPLRTVENQSQASEYLYGDTYFTSGIATPPTVP